jgi:hypothetical protein
MGTTTYTRPVADIRKVLNNFRADLTMIAQATGLWTREVVDATVEDLIRFADAGYLISVVVMTWDSKGVKMPGRKYTVSNSAMGWASDDPGGNLWPKIPGGRMEIIASLTSAWWQLDAMTQASEKTKLGISGDWTPTSTDISFSGMTAIRDRSYASNSFGMERWTYR